MAFIFIVFSFHYIIAYNLLWENDLITLLF